MVQFDPTAWAVAEAERLRVAAKQPRYHGSSGQGFSSAAPHAIAATAEVAGALEFLRRVAGDTELYRGATDGLKSSLSAYKYIDGVALILDQFVAGHASGLLTSLPFEVSSRVEASTDLMEQVELLLSDRAIHPAAPIVLAGAALEELLRSMWHLAGSPALKAKPGINAYATALQAAKVIDRQAAKDITAWAGMRNDAAHGDFTTLDVQRARLMADGVNLFMQRYAPRP
jgi:hypothetical protein